MFLLPVSGQEVLLRLPNGADELLLNASWNSDRELGLKLVERLSDLSNPRDLVVHDFEAMLLEIHRMCVGEGIDAVTNCACGERVDINFRVADYLRYRAPRQRRTVHPMDQTGWFRMDGIDLSFRLPTIGDQIAVAREVHPARHLASRCVRGVGGIRRVQSAMSMLAPLLSGPISGTCPSCREELEIDFDVPTFVLSELRVQASRLMDDVHLIAAAYHWDEQTILALPARRREYYSDRVMSDRRSGN